MQTTARRSARSLRTNIRDKEEVRHIDAIAFEVELRWMAIALEDDMLLGLVFGYATRAQAEVALRRAANVPGQHVEFRDERQIGRDSDFVCTLIERLQRYAAGEPVDFSDVRIDESHLTPFGKRIVAACRRIGWGSVRSYGELAAECGSAGAARAVGQVMAKNRFPLVVPCHRVLGAGGSLGGFSAPDGLRMKQRLLALEGRVL